MHVDERSQGLLPEILILKDVWRGANQAEAHPLLTCIAGGKSISVEHHYFMGNAMTAVMDHFINSSLAHSLTRAKNSLRTLCASRMWTRLAPALCPWRLMVGTHHAKQDSSFLGLHC